MESRAKRERLKRRLLMMGALLVAGIILWIDITTSVWQEVVILAGLAAGMVSFLLTVLVLDRVLARSAERKWAPVNRLALTDILHDLADTDQSELARGRVHARQLPVPQSDSTDPQLFDELRALRSGIVTERDRLSDSLSRWAEFLVSNGDYEIVLRHVADIALELDSLRDTTLDLEQSPGDADILARLNQQLAQCNESFTELVDEIKVRIDATGK